MPTRGRPSLTQLDAARLPAALWWLFGIAAAIRLALAATTQGSLPDINAFAATHLALHRDTLDVYTTVNGVHLTYPYLPAYLPVLEVVWKVAEWTGLAFGRLVRLPQIAADLAIAYIVQWHLGWRGASPAARLGAAALILLSPAGIALSSMHGQIDPVEWLPGVLALVAWERLPEPRRALIAGGLVGLGAAIKPPVGVLALAFLVLGSGWRERLYVAVSACAIPIVVTLPFLAADPHGVRTVFDYVGIPGQGGLSVLVEPRLAVARWAGTESFSFTGAEQAVQDAATTLTAISLVVVAAIGWWRRATPAALAAALVLAVFVFGVNFLPPYVVWLAPLTVLAGWWRFTLASYVLLLGLLPFKYLPISISDGLGLTSHGLWKSGLAWGVYVPAAILLWMLMAAQLARFCLARADDGAIPARTTA